MDRAHRAAVVLVGVVAAAGCLGWYLILGSGFPRSGRHWWILLLCAGVMAAGLLLPRGRLLGLLAKASLVVLSVSLVTGVLEIGFRLAGYDFERQQQSVLASPIYYRIPCRPIGSVFFARHGPSEWRGKVLEPALISHGGLDTTYADEPEVHVRYDREGLRNPEGLRDWEVAVVGDSFVELGYLPYEELFTSRLARLTGKRVKNVGVSSSGPLTYNCFLEEFGVSDATTDVVMVFSGGNDMYDLDVERKRLEKFRRTGVREDRHLEKQCSLIRRLKDGRQEPCPPKTHFGNAVFLSARGETEVTIWCSPPASADLGTEELRCLETTIRDWGSLARKKKVRPWVLYMPCKHRCLHEHLHFYGDAEKRLAEWKPGDLPEHVAHVCRTHSVGFIDPTAALKDACRAGVLTYNTIFDSHLNCDGCRVVADVMADALAPPKRKRDERPSGRRVPD